MATPTNLISRHHHRLLHKFSLFQSSIRLHDSASHSMNCNFAARSCRLTEGSLEYTGTHSKSETGRPCLSAQSQIPSFFETEAERESYFNNRCVNNLHADNINKCHQSLPEIVISANTKYNYNLTQRKGC